CSSHVEYVIIYFNNILIIFNTKKKYKGYIYKVLGRLHKVNFFINLKKCD
ncbi:hypothetical protein BU23DRAFT_445278, partial [Bimuria novae-zelandiae CBS 107.79]